MNEITPLRGSAKRHDAKHDARASGISVASGKDYRV
jgi:hypothetical protein